jgi:NitT/TauT family transport system substrate-binding protein
MKRLLATAFGAALIAASCAPGGATPVASPAATPSGTDVAVGPTGSPSPAASASAGPSASHVPLGTVRLALDWTPNTNHTGFYVAAANGWYRDAGVDFQVLPYGTTAPEALVGAGQADCGISFQDALTFAVALGAPIVSVMAILQHTAQDIAVLASSDIGRPRDLDGRTYAGFGGSQEDPTLRAVIKADGGKGTFKTVTLDTAAYDALYAKRADFVIMFTAWEGVEAKERGIAIRSFAFDDYGFPDFYQVVLACNRHWLAAKPELARAFLAATVRGFQLAASDPDAAAALLIAQNPGVFDGNPKLPVDSQRFLVSKGLLTDESGQVGRQTLAKWQGYSGFLYTQGLLTGFDGKPLKTAPDYGSLFTNDYLP